MDLDPEYDGWILHQPLFFLNEGDVVYVDGQALIVTQIVYDAGYITLHHRDGVLPEQWHGDLVAVAGPWREITDSAVA